MGSTTLLSMYIFFLFIFSFFFTTACKKDVTNQDKKIIRLPIFCPITSLDPRIVNEYPGAHIINMLYEGLMRLGPNGEIIPGIAQSVDITEDQRTYTFHLRESFWSNGDPVTAYDFEYAWKKSLDPLYIQGGAFTFYVIKNVPECIQNGLPPTDVGIRALDNQTLQVELQHPAPYFLDLCASSTYSPIHKQSDLSTQKNSNKDKVFIFNGPFKMKNWQKGIGLMLEKNPYYWDAHCVQVDGLDIQIILDAATQYMLFERGDLHWVGYPFTPIAGDLLENSQNIKDFNVVNSFSLYWFFLNTERPPFNNKNFRKAIAYAINRKIITHDLFSINETPALGILNQQISPYSHPYFQDGNVKIAQYHLQLALNEMGISRENLRPIVLSQGSSIFTSRMNQEIQQQLQNNLGIKIEIEQSDWPTHFNKLINGLYDFGEMAWSPWIKDPIYILNTFRNKTFITNISRWENKEYQQILHESDHEIDQNKRYLLLQKAEALLMEEMPVIPISFNCLYFKSNKKLQGVFVSPLRQIDFRYATLEN